MGERGVRENCNACGGRGDGAEGGAWRWNNYMVSESGTVESENSKQH